MKEKQNILITGGGAPGIGGTIYSLLHNDEGTKFNIVTTDIKKEVAGKYLSSAFYQIPPAVEEKAYLEKLSWICQKENIRIIIPQNTAELTVLSKNLSLFEKTGTKILISPYEAIKTANDKYRLMQLCRKAGIPVAQFFLVDKIEALKNKAVELGYPAMPVVIKPPASNGMRGVRVIDEKTDIKSEFYQKKSSLHITMNMLESILGQNFPPLIVMEYLPGLEYTVDVLKTGKDEYILPRKRLEIRNGITFSGAMDNNKQIIQYTSKILEQLDLKYCFGFQFKCDSEGTPKILECNPRVQGTMVMSTLAGANIIYAGIKALLNEPLPPMEVNWNFRFYRYWGGLGVFDSTTKDIIKIC